MSIDDVISRVTALQDLIVQAVSPTTGTSSSPGSTGSPTASFGAALSASNSTNPALLASILEQSTGALATSDGSDGSGGTGFTLPSLPTVNPLELTGLSSTAVTAPSLGTFGAIGATGTSGQAVLGAAETQLGVTEQPPGSNNGPEISGYRSAVAGAGAGEPWCAYFASWAAAQAGEPLGPTGQGFGSVSEITSWAASTGRLLPATATPTPGDLILFGDRHVGIVQSVNPDGSLTTVEGNYSNSVSQVHRSPFEATGYVAM